MCSAPEECIDSLFCNTSLANDPRHSCGSPDHARHLGIAMPPCDHGELSHGWLTFMHGLAMAVEDGSRQHSES